MPPAACCCPLQKTPARRIDASLPEGLAFRHTRSCILCSLVTSFWGELFGWNAFGGSRKRLDYRLFNQQWSPLQLSERAVQRVAGQSGCRITRAGRRRTQVTRALPPEYPTSRALELLCLRRPHAHPTMFEQSSGESDHRPPRQSCTVQARWGTPYRSSKARITLYFSHVCDMTGDAKKNRPIPSVALVKSRTIPTRNRQRRPPAVWARSRHIVRTELGSVAGNCRAARLPMSPEEV
jgi:hypothetical protein